MSPYQGSDDKIKNNDSSGIEFLDMDLELIVGRSQIKSAKISDFVDLDLMNTKLNSYRMMIHLEYFPPNN